MILFSMPARFNWQAFLTLKPKEEENHSHHIRLLKGTRFCESCPKNIRVRISGSNKHEFIEIVKNLDEMDDLSVFGRSSASIKSTLVKDNIAIFALY